MSSESEVRIFAIENLRIPEEGSSTQGKSGPKLRPKGVGDGQPVEIPVLPRSVTRDGVTQEDKRTRLMDNPGQAASQMREANPSHCKW